MSASDWYEPHKADVAAALKRAKGAAKDNAVACTLVRAKDGSFLLCAATTAAKAAALVREARNAGGKVMSGGRLYSDGGGVVFEVDEGALPARPKFAEAAAAAGVPLAHASFVAASAAVGAAEESREAAPTPAPADGGAALKEQLAHLVPVVQQMVKDHPERKNDLLQPLARCKADLDASRVAEARAALVEVAGLLRGLKARGDGHAAAEPAVSLVDLQKARLLWDGARKSVHTDLEKLKQKILEDCADDPDVDEARQCVTRLDDILVRLDEKLIDLLDQALNADGAARTALLRQAGGRVKEYVAFVETDPVVRAIDGNPFVGVGVQSTMTKTLAVLARKLPA